MVDLNMEPLIRNYGINIEQNYMEDVLDLWYIFEALTTPTMISFTCDSGHVWSFQPTFAKEERCSRIRTLWVSSISA